MKNRDLAYKDYVNGMKYKDIANKYQVSINTVKSWRSRYWKKRNNVDRKISRSSKKVAHKNEKVAHKVATKKITKLGNFNYKQIRFCELYLRFHNASKAYKIAYNTTYKNAYHHACQLVENSGIQKLMRKLQLKQLNNEFLTTQDILHEWAREAFADIGDYLDWGNDQFVGDDGKKHTYSYLNFKNKKDVDTTLIQDVHMGKDGPVIKLPDKQKALDRLYKILPQPTNKHAEENPFVKAIENSVKQINDSKNHKGH